MATHQDHYEVVRNIGSGAFGQVYLVHHRFEQHYYVMKEIASWATMDEKQRESTELEIDLLSGMSHPNIVAYRDSFVNNQGHLSIFMEYCEQGDMYIYLQEAKKAGKMIRETKTLEWFVQLVLALHALHTKKILHRDLKTQNIFLTGNIHEHMIALKLGDFGIAKVLHSTTDLAMTQIGTPFYMSPELFNNKPYGYKSDIWGLGCVLYEIINGQRPFEGQSINGLALKVLQGRFTPITAACSEESKNLIKSLLSTNPAHRPTLQEVLHNSSVRRRILPATQAVLAAGTCESRSHIESILQEQLISLGLGGVVNCPGGDGPRQDSRHILHKLERAERRRKREEDTLRRLQETAGLLAHYLKEGTPQAVGSHLSLYKAHPIDLDDSDEIEVVDHGSIYWSMEANRGGPYRSSARSRSRSSTGQPMTHVSSDNTPRVARVKLSVDLPPHSEDPNPPVMSHRDRVLLRKEQRREEEQQRFEEEARKIREENLAYQRAWVQDARDPWGQPFATARSLGAVSSTNGNRAFTKDTNPSTTATSANGARAFTKESNPSITATSHQAQQSHQQVPPSGNSIHSRHPKVANSPRRHKSPIEPKPPRPLYGQEPQSPHEAPHHHHITGRSYWSKSDHPSQTARSLHSVSLEPLSSTDGFDKLPEPSDDSGIEISDDALSDGGGRHVATDEQMHRQARIVQQRIDACRAAICRHKMTIDTLQYTFSQQQEVQHQPPEEPSNENILQYRTSSDVFSQDGATLSSDGRRRSAVVPATVQDRIKRLRRLCLEGLGNDVFQDARQCLQSLLDSGAVGEDIRMKMLDKLGLDKIGFYSLVDQIVYMECRFGAQELA